MKTGRGIPAAALAAAMASGYAGATELLGQEVAVARHLADGEQRNLSIESLIDHGQLLFDANWTAQEGGGRPLTKGTGAPLVDSFDPLVFPRNFNRISGPDANSCKGCHNVPRSGGGGDFVANVFVLGQRFDFVTFDPLDPVPTGGSVDESGNAVTLQSVANSRNTLGMFGSGYIEMLARQMSEDLQAIRDSLQPGTSATLVSKGVRFGVLRRDQDGGWDTAAVEGLPAFSLHSAGPQEKPSLLIRPFHQAGAVVSLREFTNNAFNHHHGIQSSERFGDGIDPDGDGFIDELTRADVTAATLYQALLPAPGRVIPDDAEIEAAIIHGEATFSRIGCAGCHRPSLPLYDEGQVFIEPGPFNPPGNARPGETAAVAVDLSDPRLPQPRLRKSGNGVIWVPAFTDLKLHDITAGEDSPGTEPFNMLHPAGSEAFFAGNRQFLTRKLWGIANEPPYFHHGKYTTMRQAIEAHHGEAEASHQAWLALEDYDRDAVIEFLKTLQILPEGTRHLVVDEQGRRKTWPRRYRSPRGPW